MTHPPSELPAISNNIQATRLMINVTSRPNHWMYSCFMVDWWERGRSRISWRIIGKTVKVGTDGRDERKV